MVTERSLSAVMGLTLLLFLSSCNVVNLEPLSYETYPSERNQNVPSGNVLWIEFHDSVDQLQAENAVEARTSSGVHECDYSWEGQRLILAPKTPWIPGIRYTFLLQGTFNLDDGREFSEDLVIPFYFDGPQPMPTLVSHSPSDEEVVTLEEPIILTFSASIDTESFEKNFTLSPERPVDFAWNSERTEVTVSPETAWNGLTRYTVTLSGSITDERGVPLAEEIEFQFSTFTDIDPPVLVQSIPWSIAGDAALPAQTLDDIDNSMGLYLEFDGPMDWDTWDSSWSIEPSQGFQSLFVDETAVALLPEEEWIPSQEYTLTVSEDLADVAGNYLSDDLEITFTCAIPIQSILSIEHSPADPDTDLSSGFPTTAVSISISTGLSSAHTFTLVYSRPLTSDDLTDFVDTISIDAVFPSTITQPSLDSVSLESSTRLVLLYSGFDEPEDGSSINHYFRMSQTADSEKTMNDEGSYVTEAWDLLFVVEAAP